MKRNPYEGRSLESWLKDEGIEEEARELAEKKIIAMEIERAMKGQGLSKTEMARRMRTSRAAVDRLLDRGHPSLTLTTLHRAATALGRRLEVRLAPVG